MLEQEGGWLGVMDNRTMEQNRLQNRALAMASIDDVFD
jgi:hypothetical protein